MYLAAVKELQLSYLNMDMDIVYIRWFPYSGGFMQKFHNCIEGVGVRLKGGGGLGG